ncbi:MAG: tetratricopeptide repeat protein [Planctomycetaceae bacterium]
MRRRIVAFTVVSSLLFGLTPPLFSQARDPLAGKQVMVVRWNADLKVQAKTVGRLRLGSLITADRVSGNWLWVKQARGWIARSDVVPSERAIEHFTSAINRRRSAESYHQRAVAYTAFKQFDKALADLNAAISRDPRNVAAYNDRGNVYRKLGRPKQAIADFDKVIATNVRHPAVYTNRGLAWHDLGDYDRALADFNAAIRLDARFAPAWEAGGSARQAKGEYAAAIRNYQQAIKLDAKFVRAYNNLAWIMATCRTGKHRDGKQAVEYAMKACEMTNFQEAGTLDTLAAALAESGRYDDAVKRASEAAALADDSKKKAILRRLVLYKARKPFREAPQVK